MRLPLSFLMTRQLLDLLLDNGDQRVYGNFLDEPLLERLRIAATDTMTDDEVRRRLKLLFQQWHINYKDDPRMATVANLYKQFPQRNRPRPAPPPAEVTPPQSPGPSSSRGHTSPPPPAVPKKDKKPSKSHSRNSSAVAKNEKPFNLQKELPQLMDVLAKASIASTNLKNTLKRINREIERPSENQECNKQIHEANHLRKQILRYIQHVESEQWLGSLIHANEELVDAIVLFKAMDKPIEEDSDSEGWNDIEEGSSSVSRRMGAMSMGDRPEDRPTLPSRPPPLPKGKSTYQDDDDEEEDDDEDNPFSNRNRIDDAPAEKAGLHW